MYIHSNNWSQVISFMWIMIVATLILLDKLKMISKMIWVFFSGSFLNRNIGWPKDYSTFSCWSIISYFVDNLSLSFSDESCPSWKSFPTGCHFVINAYTTITGTTTKLSAPKIVEILLIVSANLENSMYK